MFFADCEIELSVTKTIRLSNNFWLVSSSSCTHIQWQRNNSRLPTLVCQSDIYVGRKVIFLKFSAGMHTHTHTHPYLTNVWVNSDAVKGCRLPSCDDTWQEREWVPAWAAWEKLGWPNPGRNTHNPTRPHEGTPGFRATRADCKHRAKALAFPWHFEWQ